MVAKNPRVLASLDYKKQQSVVIASLGETAERERNSYKGIKYQRSQDGYRKK